MAEQVPPSLPTTAEKVSNPGEVLDYNRSYLIVQFPSEADAQEAVRKFWKFVAPGLTVPNDPLDSEITDTRLGDRTTSALSEFGGGESSHSGVVNFENIYGDLSGPALQWAQAQGYKETE